MTDITETAGQNAPHPVKTDYELGQDNITPFGLDIHNPVFLVSGISIVAFVILTLMFQDAASEFFTNLRNTLTTSLDWFFLSAANIFVLFCLALMITPLGSIRLGGHTVDRQGAATDVITKGRHDPCVGIRAVPIVEAMLAIVLMDHSLRQRAQNADVKPETPVIPSTHGC